MKLTSRFPKWNLREIGSNLAELSGIGAISAGFWQLSPAAGLISGGVGLVVIGVTVGSPPGSLRLPRLRAQPSEPPYAGRRAG